MYAHCCSKVNVIVCIYICMNLCKAEWCWIFNGAGNQFTWSSGDGEIGKRSIWRVQLLPLNMVPLTLLLDLFPLVTKAHVYASYASFWQIKSCFQLCCKFSKDICAHSITNGWELKYKSLYSYLFFVQFKD